MVPDVPVTVILYVPAVVPEFPPPQAATPLNTNRRSSPNIASQLRRRGTKTNTTNASAVPPAGQKSFFLMFSALDAGVVVTVSVDVCAVVPLIVTEAGFRLHVGASMTLVIDVVTLQLRLTVPLNAFVPATLIVTVFSLVSPGVTVREAVPPPPGAMPGCGFTVKLRVTGVAAAQSLLPFWVAWMVHVPAMVNVAVVPLTVQTAMVWELKPTVRPEVAVALSVSDVPAVCVPGLLKVIACVAWTTLKLCGLPVAAL
jgi:hypothetical protein